MENIEAKLAELGPGSSAIIGCDWTDGGGHWFNAIDEDGVITAVDGQSGDVETWPPSIDGLGFDQSDMNASADEQDRRDQDQRQQDRRDRQL